MNLKIFTYFFEDFVSVTMNKLFLVTSQVALVVKNPPEYIWISSNEMDETGTYYTEWSAIIIHFNMNMSDDKCGIAEIQTQVFNIYYYIIKFVLIHNDMY